MNYKKVNEELANLFSFRNRNDVVESKYNNYDGDDYEIYKLDGDIHVKFFIEEDSYSGNKTITGINFVRPTEVIMTNFQTLE